MQCRGVDRKRCARGAASKEALGTPKRGLRRRWYDGVHTSTSNQRGREGKEAMSSLHANRERRASHEFLRIQ